MDVPILRVCGFVIRRCGGWRTLGARRHAIVVHRKITMSRALKITNITHIRDITSSKSRMYERFRKNNVTMSRDRITLLTIRNLVELEAGECQVALHSLWAMKSSKYSKHLVNDLSSTIWIAYKSPEVDRVRAMKETRSSYAGSSDRVTAGVMRFDPAE